MYDFKLLNAHARYGRYENPAVVSRNLSMCSANGGEKRNSCTGLFHLPEAAYHWYGGIDRQ